ncbi:MAG: DUF2513 domain-containing protein [Ignavibacteria bacterium]
MGRNENLIRKILQIIEERPYCSSSAISIKGFSKDCIFIQLSLICREHLIAAEPAIDENGIMNDLFNIRLTLSGLNYLRSISYFQTI